MKHFNLVFILLLLITVACQKENDTPVSQKFIETAYMDSTVNPGDDFYSFVNGKWVKNATIPDTESEVGAFLELYNRTRDNLRVVLDEAANGTFPAGSIEQKVGDYYASGMDSLTIEKRGYEPVKPYLDQINALKDAPGIMAFEAMGEKDGLDYFMGVHVGADEKNSTVNILNFLQAGLGLPDREYYFMTDPNTTGVQNAYKKFMRRVFELTGDDSVAAIKKAEAAYGLEKQMATSHRTNVELRNPQINYNKKAVAELDKKMPNIGWSVFIKALGVNADSVNIAQPAYYEKLNALLKSVPVDTWKAYLRFHTIYQLSPTLPHDFVNARFDYIGRALNGQQKMRPRWERIYRYADNDLGEALGQLYVKKYFTDEAKKRMLELVNNLDKAFEARISKLDWMSDATKQTAHAKLHTFLKKIGYPDTWRDYSKVNIDSTKFFENVIACYRDNVARELAKVGKPVDRTEWGMSPPTINAYYNPTFNEIVFPAG
ncbi:MAG TPA: M13 family metallopeptidase, partial [Ohtaekwangia sp.]